MHFYCLFFVCVFLWGSVLAMGRFLPHPQIPAPRLVTPRGSSRPGTEQLWSHRAVSFRISYLSDHQERSEDPKLKLHLFTICCLFIFSSYLSILSRWSILVQGTEETRGGWRDESWVASLSEVSCMTHAPPSSFLHLINFLPAPLELWRAAIRTGRGLWKDTSRLSCVCAQEVWVERF